MPVQTNMPYRTVYQYDTGTILCRQATRMGPGTSTGNLGSNGNYVEHIFFEAFKSKTEFHILGCGQIQKTMEAYKGGGHSCRP